MPVFYFLLLFLTHTAFAKQPSLLQFTRGSAQASIEVHSYMDYLCPFCSQQNTVLHKLINTFPEQVRWHFYIWPNSHESSQSLAHLAYCHGLINGNSSFWTLSDKLLSLPKATLKSEGLSQSLILSQRLANPEKILVCIGDNNTTNYFVVNKEKANNHYQFVGTPGLVVIDAKGELRKVLSTHQGLIKFQDLSLMLGLKKTAD